MPVAISPLSVFTAPEWSRLTRRTRWRGPLLVAHCWAAIGLVCAAAAIWPNPVTWLVAVVVVGARQLGLAILMHDAAHGLLHEKRRINDFLGRWLCAAPVGASLDAYRRSHLSHHRFTQQDQDPDLVLSAPFPITRASLRRKMLRDLAGLTFLKQRFGLSFGGRPEPSAATNELLGEAGGRKRDFYAANAVLLALFWAAGAPLLFPLVWIVAMATWLPLATRIRNIAEHACTDRGADPLTNTRTTRAGLLARALVAPYWVNHHIEHHLFTAIPCHRLAAAHRLLAAKGLGERMRIAPGYLHVLREAASRPVPAS